MESLSSLIRQHGYSQEPKSKTGPEHQITVPLNSSSYVKLWYSNAALEADFETLWSRKPEKRGVVRMLGKETKLARWQQAYNLPYYFSGMIHEAIPLPDEFKPFLEELRASHYNEFCSTGFNGVFVNWYEDGSDYIGPHSDDVRQLVKGPEGNTLIYSLTLQEGPGHRIFRIKPKLPQKGSLPTELRKKLGRQRTDIQLKHGLVVMMGGQCQRDFKHQVPPTKKKVGRRINITIRCFWEQED